MLERYSGETYGRALLGVYLAAPTVWLVSMYAGHAAAGFAAFLVIFAFGLAMDLALRRSSVVLYDERYERISRKASDAVFNVYGGGGFVVFVSLIALEFLGYYEMTPRVETLFLAWSAFVLSWGVCYTAFKSRA